MTSIKPPDGRIPGAGAPSSPAVDQDAPATQAERAGASYRDAADAVERPLTQPVSGAAGASATDPIAALAQAVRSGDVSPSQALDQLVEQAAARTERTLSAAQRAELTAVLRSALETDPALAALRDALNP